MTHSSRHWPRLALALALGILTATALVARQPAAVEPATLVLRNGRIVTVDDGRPEARALAARGDRILALGSDDEIARYIGTATQVINLAGQLAIPGLIEGHGHFLGVGQAAMSLNLMKVKSWDEVVAMVANAARAAKPGA